jgi:hypothetical protein
MKIVIILQLLYCDSTYHITSEQKMEFVIASVEIVSPVSKTLSMVEMVRSPLVITHPRGLMQLNIVYVVSAYKKQCMNPLGTIIHALHTQ